MEQDIIINDTFSVAYSDSLQAAFKLNPARDKKKIIVPDTKANAQTDGEIVMWGSDNLFPQRVLKEIRENTIVGTTLDKQARIAYEAGIEYGKKSVKDGELKHEEVIIPEVEAFFRRSKIHRYCISALRQFYYFYAAFPEIVFTLDRTEVYSIRADKTKTAYCRYKKPVNGVLDTVCVHADWNNAPTFPETIQIPVIDPFVDPEYYKEEGKDFKYIYPLSYPTENEDFYPLVDWNSLRSSGWLEVAQAVPAFKKALFKNQISIKYLIEVSTWWWNWKYPGFDQFDTKKKQKIQKEELTRFNNFMVGTEKTGNTLMVTFSSNPQMQKEYPGWKITPIESKLKDGAHISDSNEASSHLLFALGMDPAIIGSQPGSKMGAGSGSDKRVAFNIYSDLVRSHQEIILEPLYFIAEYNGWDVDYFRFRNLKEKEEPPSRSPMNEQETDPVQEPNQQAS